ncbi:MAG: porin [Gammaproteobacteria bacterium]|nr:porin [Gammaproteobacteria bacterium]
MNKKLIAVAVVAGLALPMVSAHAVEVADKKLEVYGKLHLSLSQNDQLGTVNDNWLLESNASRLGFKGQIPLDAGLTGTYKFESEIAVEEGTTTFAGRNTYLGLKGSFGEVRLGRHDSPLKMAQGKFDQFGDTAGDLKNAGDEDGENRNLNSITYLGKFADVGVNVQLIPGEGDGTTGGQGIADTTSIAVSYNAGPLYVAVAHDSYDDTAGAAEASLIRLVATYKVGDMQFGLLSQSGVEAPDAVAAKEDWLGLSFNMKMGSKNKLKAQYITVKDSATTALEGTQLSVGFDHKVGKKGTVYAMYNTITEENATTQKENTTISAGYILKF